MSLDSDLEISQTNESYFFFIDRKTSDEKINFSKCSLKNLYNDEVTLKRKEGGRIYSQKEVCNMQSTEVFRGCG